MSVRLCVSMVCVSVCLCVCVSVCLCVSMVCVSVCLCVSMVCVSVCLSTEVLLYCTVRPHVDVVCVSMVTAYIMYFQMYLQYLLTVGVCMCVGVSVVVHLQTMYLCNLL